MRLVADENVDAPIVAALRASGQEVWYVAEEAAGLEDHDVLERAARTTALLITSDKDFGELVFRQGKADAGVLLLRLAGVPSIEKARIVTRVVNEHPIELIGSFSVVTRTVLRVRKGDHHGRLTDPE